MVVTSPFQQSTAQRPQPTWCGPLLGYSPTAQSDLYGPWLVRGVSRNRKELQGDVLFRLLRGQVERIMEVRAADAPPQIGGGWRLRGSFRLFRFRIVFGLVAHRRDPP